MNVGYTEGKMAVDEVRIFLKDVERRLDDLDAFIAKHVNGPVNSEESWRSSCGFKEEFMREIKSVMLGADDTMKIDYEKPVFMWALEKARKRILYGIFYRFFV